VSTYNQLSEFADLEADADQEASADVEDVDLPVVDVRAERDGDTYTWQNALKVEAGRIEDRSGRGQYQVHGTAAILALEAVEDGPHRFRGWCECDVDGACYHLCALAQHDVVDTVSLPVVDT
jgi:hypothetical protein